MTALAVVLVMSLPGCGDGPTVPEEQSEPESGTGVRDRAHVRDRIRNGERARGVGHSVRVVADGAAEPKWCQSGHWLRRCGAEFHRHGDQHDAVVSLVRVEVHLSNGIELGPTPSLNLTPAQTSPVALSADGQQFTTWSVHVEIGEDEH